MPPKVNYKNVNFIFSILFKESSKKIEGKYNGENCFHEISIVGHFSKIRQNNVKCQDIITDVKISTEQKYRFWGTDFTAHAFFSPHT